MDRCGDSRTFDAEMHSASNAWKNSLVFEVPGEELFLSGWPEQEWGPWRETYCPESVLHVGLIFLVVKVFVQKDRPSTM